MQNPKVSVITPTYNSAGSISTTITSVLNQTYQNLELIVIDDCSTDNTVKIVQEFQSIDPRIALVQLNQNSGAAIARNKGIAKARGRYIAFLDSDDLWFPQKLEKQLKYMDENGFAFTYTAYKRHIVDQQRTVLIGVPAKVNYNDTLKTCRIGCLTVLYDTEQLGKLEMPLIKKRQDFGLWLRILRKTPFAHGLNEVLAQCNARPDSLSANKFEAAKYNWIVYRKIEKLNFFLSGYYFFCYSITGLLRHKFPKLSVRLGLLQKPMQH